MGALDLYLSGIKMAITQFPDRWALIVMRSEQWGRIRRNCMKDRPAGFNPDRPWSYVIAASAYGAQDSPSKEWWSNRFVLPVLTTSSTSAARARIALIEGSSAACRVQQDPPRQRSRSRGRGRDRDEPQPRNDKPKKEICNLYNSNKKPCKGTLVCAWGRSHECKKCGKPHPVSECRGGKKGKGKGKNKNQD